MPIRRRLLAAWLSVLLTAAIATHTTAIDPVVVAKIREEGMQRSQVMEFEAYLTDVLGARLTLSRDMQRAQAWVQREMTRIGLVNVAAEPFMDFGVTWDNEYVSLHLFEPDYQPMVGYPVAHTGSTQGIAGRSVPRDAGKTFAGRHRPSRTRCYLAEQAG